MSYLTSQVPSLRYQRFLTQSRSIVASGASIRATSSTAKPTSTARVTPGSPAASACGTLGELVLGLGARGGGLLESAAPAGFDLDGVPLVAVGGRLDTGSSSTIRPPLSTITRSAQRISPGSWEMTTVVLPRIRLRSALTTIWADSRSNPVVGSSR